MKRYEAFLFQQRPNSKEYHTEGLSRRSNGISQDVAIENRCHARLVETIYYSLVELFDITDVSLITSNEYYALFLKTDEKLLFNPNLNRDQEMEGGFESARLCREKIKNASAMEISAAFIDLIIERKQWSKFGWSTNVGFLFG